MSCILNVKLVFKVNDLKEKIYAKCFKVEIAEKIINFAFKKFCFFKYLDQILTRLRNLRLSIKKIKIRNLREANYDLQSITF